MIIYLPERTALHTHDMKTALIALSLALVICSGAHGGTFSYQCTISEQLFLQADGSVKRPPSPWLIGSRFSIDRRSGKILGPERSLWAFEDAVFAVLAPGNAENSFIVSATSAARGGGVHHTAINVQEFIKSPKKPFVALSATELYSGVCE